MIKAYVFPGQGAQFVGMGKDLYEKSSKAKDLFRKANTILKFQITDIMFDGTEDDLRQTKVTQPAVFLHSVILASLLEDFEPSMVAGHSLGEFSALVANKVLTFEDGLRLVSKRAMAMQKACEARPGTMAAVMGMEDAAIESICASVKDLVVVPANYNSPGQLVISGSIEGVNAASEKLKAAGAKRVAPLSVGGAFHSPLMEPARVELAEAINDLGMEFGLWFEPEMISVDSELYRKHPDWAIHIKGREHIYSREQLVLDLSKKEVCDYLIDSITRVLQSANITYVKWDMNRNITSISEGQANATKHEFYHRYILGLYRILDTLTQAFPHVLFESCAGGGGRNDLGMLYYMPQAWASDNTDAIGRLSIQEGTSLIYPIASMGAHVSAVPNHQVGRITPFSTRGNVAMLGNLGYELDLTALSDSKKKEVASQTALYKSIRQTVQFGNIYRLQQTENTKAYTYVNKDKSQAVFTFVKILAQSEAPLVQVRLKGLEERALYHCPQLDASFYGDELMNIGLTMPHIQKDFFSVQYIFNKI